MIVEGAEPEFENIKALESAFSPSKRAKNE